MTTTPLESSNEYYGYVRIEVAEMYAQECAAAEVAADRASRAPNESMESTTLRDYFAAKVITGIAGIDDLASTKQCAQFAYDVADEMMKARAL